uniref:MAGUK p55 scaffold protein 7a n=1 Tax=Mastacembelus armatus TaxID=205130 RepID=A0A3Q3MJR4_9TELE
KVSFSVESNSKPFQMCLYELLAALPSQLHPHVSCPEDNTFLQDMFGERSLHSLVKIHERLQHYDKSKPVPILDSAAALACEVSFIDSLLSVHDTVAQKSYDPELPPLPEDIDDDEDSVKIIRLVKNKEPLGATIMRDEHTGAILVARIMRGGAADRSGLIHVGDELKEVNGIPVDDKKPEEIIRILAQSQGAITFKVVPSIKEEAPTKEPKMFVKALFDYDPKEDKAIPCKEAGLAFKKGSILQIMSQDDATWWQAKVEGDANPRAGLIPSKQFQESHEAEVFVTESCGGVCQVESGALVLVCKQMYLSPFFHSEPAAGFRRSFRLSRRDKKTNKSMYECKKSEIYDMADVPTYEEVAPYCRRSGAKHRLVVLVGPTGVGLNELKKKLLISDPQHFSVTIPHTTRAKRNQETDGVEYHFISKHLFETDIHNNKFIEYGEYKGNFYGTSLDSIRSVLSKNKVCLLDVQPHTLKHLRTSEFKPYVVFVKPPSVERLRETRKSGKMISAKDDKGSSKPFTEDDFQVMVSTAETMETQYGHLFEKILVNDDLSEAFAELRLALKKVETETQWVPVSWTQS